MSSWFESWLGDFSGVITEIGCSTLLMHAPVVNRRQRGVSGLPLAFVWASMMTALFASCDLWFWGCQLTVVLMAAAGFLGAQQKCRNPLEGQA